MYTIILVWPTYCFLATHQLCNISILRIYITYMYDNDNGYGIVSL